MLPRHMSCSCVVPSRPISREDVFRAEDMMLSVCSALLAGAVEVTTETGGAVASAREHRGGAGSVAPATTGPAASGGRHTITSAHVAPSQPAAQTPTLPSALPATAAEKADPAVNAAAVEAADMRVSTLSTAGPAEETSATQAGGADKRLPEPARSGGAGAVADDADDDDNVDIMGTPAPGMLTCHARLSMY